jgi:dUTP pyrophosphatase
MLLGIKKLHKDAVLPTYADPGASGFDFYAINSIKIGPKCSGVVITGLAFEIPKNYEIQARGRSGLAFNSDVIAHFGTIDESFKGELKIKLFNLGDKPLIINVGDRVAQGVFAPVVKADFYERNELSESQRGESGFGHTGK